MDSRSNKKEGRGEETNGSSSVSLPSRREFHKKKRKINIHMLLAKLLFIIFILFIALILTYSIVAI